MIDQLNRTLDRLAGCWLAVKLQKDADNAIDPVSKRGIEATLKEHKQNCKQCQEQAK